MANAASRAAVVAFGRQYIKDNAKSLGLYTISDMEKFLAAIEKLAFDETLEELAAEAQKHKLGY